ncbi:MAG: flagellar hook-basal body complex protein [bacterium]|nr:flagellar hook-basal body complex protein [bacterium]
MITGLYSAASGMIIQERVQDVLAQNMAGSMMPGFKREETVIRSFPDVMLSETYRGLSPSTDKPRYNHAIGRVGTGAGVDWVYVDYTGGQMRYTGSKTDVSIFGDGFFAVKTPDGMRFTRSGNFVVNDEGYLTTTQGHYVMGQGANNNNEQSPIYVGNKDFYINYYGEVFTQQPDQNGVMRNTLMDQVVVVDFADKNKLFREPGNLYRVEDGDTNNFTIPDKYQVAQGYIEESNTDPTTEMVKMIDSFRTFEASSRVLKAIDQSVGRAVNEVGRPG